MLNTIPDMVEILRLPTLAIIAFAARCAERAKPVWLRRAYLHLGTDAAGSVAIDVAADAAARTTAAAHNKVAAAKAAAAAAVAAAANPNITAVDTGGGVFYISQPDLQMRGHSLCNKAIRRDFDRLVALARQDSWGDDTPVSPDVFGPMWQEGEAPTWALEAEANPSPANCAVNHSELVLGFTVEDFAPTELASEKVLALLAAINEYHVAAGGDGLQFDNLELFQAAEEPAGVPV
jgi:hypothetical protein